MPKSRFSFRALTSLSLFWAFLSPVLTGVAWFVAPMGRIANWTDWRLMGLALSKVADRSGLRPADIPELISTAGE